VPRTLELYFDPRPRCIRYAAEQTVTKAERRPHKVRIATILTAQE